MYCKQMCEARADLNIQPLHSCSSNYYTPEANCLDAGMAGSKGLCGICGEKSKWKKPGQNDLKTHSTKCCPYKYHLGINDRKQFVDGMAEMIKYLLDKEEAKFEGLATDNHMLEESNVKLVNDLHTQTTLLDETTANLNFMKDIFSPTLIKQRKEEYQQQLETIKMSNEDISTKKGELKKIEAEQNKKDLLLTIK